MRNSNYTHTFAGFFYKYLMPRVIITKLSDVQDIWEQIRSVDPEVLPLDHSKSISAPVNSISVERLSIHLYVPAIYTCIFILQHQIHVLRLRLLRAMYLIDGGPKKERKKTTESRTIGPSAKRKATLKTSMTRALELAVSQGGLSGTQGNVPDRAGTGLDGLDPEAVLRSHTSSSTRSLLETQLGSQLRTGDSVNAQFLTIAHATSQQVTLDPEPNPGHGEEDLPLIDMGDFHPPLADNNIEGHAVFSAEKQIHKSVIPIRKKRMLRPRSFTHLYDTKVQESLKYIDVTKLQPSKYTLLDDDILMCLPSFTNQPPWLLVDQWWAKNIPVLVFTYEGSSPAFFGALASKSKTHTLTASHDLDQRGTSSAALPVNPALSAETTSASTFSDRVHNRNMDYSEGDAFNISYHGESGFSGYSSTATASSKLILQRLEEKYPQSVSLNSMLKPDRNIQQKRHEVAALFLIALNLRASGAIKIKQGQHDIFCSLPHTRSNL